MPKFKYKAMKQDGTTFTGEMNAKSTNDVVVYLKSKKYYPVSIKKQNEASSMEIHFSKKAKAKDLTIFCKQLSAMMESGMPIINSMDIMMVQSTNKLLRDTSADIFEDLQKGATFSEALKRHPNVFPELMIHMVESGELSGNMDSVLKKLSVHYDKEAKISRKIKGAMVYPIILSLAAIVMVTFMLTFVLPTFVTMFTSAGVDLPGPTKFVMGVSKSIRSFWYIYILVIISIVVGTSVFNSSERGKQILHRLRFKIPILKTVTQMIVTTRFTRTMATLLYSGVPLLQALENVSKVVGNVIVEEELLKVRDEVRRGQELAAPIKRMALFPPMVDNMIKIGEESGTLDDILDKTADFFDDELEAAINQMTTMFEPLLIVIMGVVLGFIVVAMALPMFDIMQTIS